MYDKNQSILPFGLIIINKKNLYFKIKVEVLFIGAEGGIRIVRFVYPTLSYRLFPMLNVNFCSLNIPIIKLLRGNNRGTEFAYPLFSARRLRPFAPRLFLS